MIYHKKNQSIDDIFSDMEKPCTPSFYQKKGAIAASIFSLIWIVFIIDYLISSGWWANRGTLSPAEFIGETCGLFLPIVVATLIAAYFDRSAQLHYESQTLQSYLNELVYPTAEGAIYTKTLTDALRTQIKEFRSVFEQVQAQTNKVRDDLKGWISDLSNVINHVDTKTIESVKEIASHIHTLTEATQMANEQAEHASSLFAEQAAILGKVTQQTSETIGKLSQSLSMNIEEITNTTHAIETTNERTSQALQVSENVVKELQNGSSKIEQAIALYEESAKQQNARLFGNLEKVLSVFKAHGAILDQEVEKTANRLRVVENTFNENSKTLYASADEAVFRLNEVGAQFDARTRKVQETMNLIRSDMLEISDSLVLQAKQLDSHTGGKMKKKATDDFLREGKIILDRLQSFSVDMAKIFSPKAEETLWQRYNNGDKTAFMRHITKELNSSQTKKIKELIKIDPEFKLAVSRYMAEFEGMTKAAQAEGENNLMMSILIGSDVGRLYMVLADILRKGK
ncbi:MAG: methyl-accepting chemotaxis protein [Alphaproteobacteria bacterium]|nr:methyl-accepting chemotaxis protein [Alphaproteobacteria bacterium]